MLLFPWNLGPHSYLDSHFAFHILPPLVLYISFCPYIFSISSSWEIQLPVQTIPLSLFSAGKYKGKFFFQNLETEKPDGHLSRQSIWLLPAYLLAVDVDSSVLYWIFSGAEARTGLWDQNKVPDRNLTKPVMTDNCPTFTSENKNSEKVDHLLRSSISMHSALGLLLILLPRFISRILTCICFCSVLVFFGLI